MFDRLIASKRHAADRPAVPGGTVSVLLHAGVCAAAVLATLRPHRVVGVEGNHPRTDRTPAARSTRPPDQCRRSMSRHNPRLRFRTG